MECFFFFARGATTPTHDLGVRLTLVVLWGDFTSDADSFFTLGALRVECR